MHIKALLASLLLFAAFPGLSFADSASKEEKLDQLVNIMDMDSMVENMYSQMELMMQNMATELGVKAEEQTIFDEYYNKMTLLLKEDMSWQKMKPFVIDIYRRNFSEKEIDDMLAFYGTETGQALLQKMPTVMQESMIMSQALAQQTLPKLQEIGEELRMDLEKARSEK